MNKPYQVEFILDCKIARKARKKHITTNKTEEKKPI